MGVDLEKLARDLGEAYEEINQLHWEQVESNALKMLALKVGVDHTREPDWVLEQIGREWDLLTAEATAWAPRADNEIISDGRIINVGQIPKSPNSWTHDPNLGWITPLILTSKERPW